MIFFFDEEDEQAIFTYGDILKRILELKEKYIKRNGFVPEYIQITKDLDHFLLQNSSKNLETTDDIINIYGMEIVIK